jgi:hypothetical protein
VCDVAPRAYSLCTKPQPHTHVHALPDSAWRARRTRSRQQARRVGVPCLRGQHTRIRMRTNTSPLSPLLLYPSPHATTTRTSGARVCGCSATLRRVSLSTLLNFDAVRAQERDVQQRRVKCVGQQTSNTHDSTCALRDDSRQHFDVRRHAVDGHPHIGTRGCAR